MTVLCYHSVEPDWDSPLAVRPEDFAAQAAGVPVVATDVGDVDRMVLDGRTGRLVPPRNRPALQAALRDLLVDPDRRAQMGREARRHVRANFDESQVLHELGATFDRLRGIA